MTFVFDPPIVPSVAVAEMEARLPVRRILCVGRNYAEHAREMGRDPNREAPFFFAKPADAVVDSGETIPYPSRTQNFHYEAELVAVIGKPGRNILENEALS